MQNKNTDELKKIILQAAEKARRETSDEPEPELTKSIQWPLQCTVGPGLEGAVACESTVGYVNGSKGWLIYRGYDIFDLSAQSNFEETTFLLLHGYLPSPAELSVFQKKLINYRVLNKTLRRLMGFAVEEMNAMAALRMATVLVHHEFTAMDREDGRPTAVDAIGADEDSIAMETIPRGEKHAIYEFNKSKDQLDRFFKQLETVSGIGACYQLIASLAVIAAAIARLHKGKMPVDPDPSLSHAGNFLYMMTGSRPTPVEERIMDIALILHADHGMNASTFATLVTASTLSDLYLSVGSGIAALSGPLHGGANEQVVIQLQEIGDPANVKAWVKDKISKKEKISGFGHRVYKAYDPRARILGPLAAYLADKSEETQRLYATACELEKEVGKQFGSEKKIFPNVDFYSGIVYYSLGIAPEMFTPIFAVSRVSGWTARTLEYLQSNRIFRPRAMYSGEFGKKYVPLEQR